MTRPESHTRLVVVAQQLRRLVEAATGRFDHWSAADSTRPVRPGGWSRRELVGHLLDSASNNHQRIVRAQLDGRLRFPSYDQDGWVAVQGYAETDWPALVGFWRAYNLHLARLIERIPPRHLDTPCLVGPDPSLTLAELADDYLNHLEHHLRQLGVSLP